MSFRTPGAGIDVPSVVAIAFNVVVARQTAVRRALVVVALDAVALSSAVVVAAAECATAALLAHQVDALRARRTLHDTNTPSLCINTTPSTHLLPLNRCNMSVPGSCSRSYCCRSYRTVPRIGC